MPKPPSRGEVSSNPNDGKYRMHCGSDALPTARLVLPDLPPGAANARIRAHAEEMRAQGERPWFEVWYPHTTSEDFDAVEVDEHGKISTLPPYVEMGGGA